jgi:hypothetical protein
MNLRPSSEYVLMYTKEQDYSELLKDVFDSIDKLFLEKALIQFKFMFIYINILFIKITTN